MNIEEVRKEATKQLNDEAFAEAVKVEKERLSVQKTLWEKFFPWKITIVRR